MAWFMAFKTRAQWEHAQLAAYYDGYIRRLIDATAPEDFETQTRKDFKALMKRMSYHIERMTALD